MKIYTKTGDAGDTGLFAGPRVRKNDLRIEAYGTVDELNSVLGLVRASGPPSDLDAALERIQNELFDLGAELATPDPAARGTDLIGAAKIGRLEADIDRYEATLPLLKQFVLPGGTPAAAWLHLARTVCRRAERHVISLFDREHGKVSSDVVIYLNRLSDLLFVMARAANQAAGVPDSPWRKT